MKVMVAGENYLRIVADLDRAQRDLGFRKYAFSTFVVAQILTLVGSILLLGAGDWFQGGVWILMSLGCICACAGLLYEITEFADYVKSLEAEEKRIRHAFVDIMEDTHWGEA